jgi:hypothetical protein
MEEDRTVEGYSVKICICWGEVVIQDPTLSLRFATEEEAERYSLMLQTGPALVRAIREAQEHLRAVVRELCSQPQHTDQVAAAYGVLSMAVEGLKEAL